MCARVFSIRKIVTLKPGGSMKQLPAFLIMLTAISAVGTPIICKAATYKVSIDESTLQQALTQLSQYTTLQKALNIQNIDLAYATKKTLIMADLLITSDGMLNVSAARSIKEAFIPTNPQAYEEDMKRVLNQLDNSWKSFFANVKAPQSSNKLCCLVLRALFSLKPDQEITDRHARVALLASMLSPYNQGPVGDCFAVADVIRNHEENYRHAAADYASIIMQGFIERQIDNDKDCFFFLPSLADDDRQASFYLNSDGTFSNTNYSLFDAPGFAAARDLMGCGDISNLTSSVMQELTSNETVKSIESTPSEVIRAIAKVVADSTSAATTDNLISIGNYAFSCLTNNPILRATEAIFSSMAEDRPNDSVRKNINNCIGNALANTWEKSQRIQGVAEFQKAFSVIFNNSYRLVYNLDIALTKVSSDGSSHSGGFELYERVPGNKALLGKKITTPQEFRQLILNALATTVEQLGSTPKTLVLANTLASVINHDSFLKEALWAYDEDNKKESNPVKNYQKLVRTPMQNCDGDNPFEVTTIDTGICYDNRIQFFTPKNAMDLICWCFKMAKVASVDIAPMDNPLHAFNFMPKDPDLAAFVKSRASAAKWLQKMLVSPGMLVSRQKIDPIVREAIASSMEAELKEIIHNSDYKKLVQTLAKKELSVQGYTQQLLDGINKLFKSDQAQAYQIALALDKILIRCLSEEAREILSQSAIRFAFTNWSEGTKDIYFCVFFNPRSEQIAFGSMFEDKTNLQPMDENEWVNNQEWDVNLRPAVPLSPGL